jgi:HPt (histidine-containing phosphotransfer) domain-containing protein
MHMIHLIDHDYLAQLAEDIGDEGVHEVLGVFSEDAPGYLATLQQAYADGRLAELRRTAHALAGAARNAGLTPLGEAAYALQVALERTEPDAADVAALIRLAEASLAAIGDWNGATEAPGPEGPAATRTALI